MKSVFLLLAFIAIALATSMQPQCPNGKCNFLVTSIKTDDPTTHHEMEINIDFKRYSILINGENMYVPGGSGYYYKYAHETGYTCEPTDEDNVLGTFGTYLYPMLIPNKFEYVGEDMFMGRKALRFTFAEAGMNAYVDKASGAVLGGESRQPSASYTFVITNIKAGNSAGAFNVPAECRNVAAPTRTRLGGIIHYTHEEMLNAGAEYHTVEDHEYANLPKSVDYTRGTTHYAPPVLDQGMCGSCWSHSLAGSIYGQIVKYKGVDAVSSTMMPSRQFFMDCAPADYGNGCNGGVPPNVLQWVSRYRGNIPTELAYPYRETDHSCKASQVPADQAYPAGLVTGVKVVPEGDEKALQHALATVGPISIAVCDGLPGWQGSAAVAKTTEKCTPDHLNHAVLLVGYGVDETTGEEYWLVQNSWSALWRDNGNLRVARNRGNQYGVSLMASYPVIDVSKIPK